MSTDTTAEALPSRGLTQKLLDGVETVGNKVPHPVLMFLYLIIIIIALSHILYMFGVSVTEQIATPVTPPLTIDYYEDTTEPGILGFTEPYDVQYEIQETTIAIRSLLTRDGIRFLFTSFVPNFAGFGVVATILIAMAGVGVAEHAGMMAALIRKLVKVAPHRLITFFIVLVGVVSSVATDAGYLILIPLGAAAFLSLRRHPLAGMAAAYAGVSAAFAVNVIITPSDSMITEITNEAIALAGGEPITVVANIYFTIVSTIAMALVATFITDRVIEKRLGGYEPPADMEIEEELDEAAQKAEARGLRYALLGLLGISAIIAIFTLPPNAPLRDPQSGAIIGSTPFMDSLIFIISLIFLVSGIFYGIGAKTISGSDEVISAITKTFASLAGLIFMLLMISQFIAYFNYSNMPTVLAVALADTLEAASVGPLVLLVGMILVIMFLNIIIPGVVPKWAIFAPVFIPVFMRLGVSPQTALAAYRVGDSPTNVITPLMVYLPFIITVTQRYDKNAGIGTVIALMLPYTIAMAIVWILLYILWFVVGIPLGPGYPVGM